MQTVKLFSEVEVLGVRHGVGAAGSRKLKQIIIFNTHQHINARRRRRLKNTAFYAAARSETIFAAQRQNERAPAGFFFFLSISQSFKSPFQSRWGAWAFAAAHVIVFYCGLPDVASMSKRVCWLM